MTEALFVVSMVALLAAASVILAVAGLILHRVQKYAELAEQRMEMLREGQERLLAFLEEERKAESTELGSIEQKVHRLELEVQALRKSPEEVVETVSHGSGAVPANRKPPSREQPPESNPPASPEEKQGELGYKHLHPDDVVRKEKATAAGDSAGAEGTHKKMFSEHYDRYLENYEGYVELAKRIYEMRREDKTLKDSPAHQEWEQKLDRVKDGIQRTAARLDILEQYNPELASDYRILHRAEISQSYSELEEKLSGIQTS